MVAMTTFELASPRGPKTLHFQSSVHARDLTAPSALSGEDHSTGPPDSDVPFCMFLEVYNGALVAYCLPTHSLEYVGTPLADYSP